MFRRNHESPSDDSSRKAVRVEVRPAKVQTYHTSGGLIHLGWQCPAGLRETRSIHHGLSPKANITFKIKNYSLPHSPLETDLITGAGIPFTASLQATPVTVTKAPSSGTFAPSILISTPLSPRGELTFAPSERMK